jgi:hypothetical protein
MPEVPEVEEIAGEFFRFHVISRTNPAQKHLVDLEAYKWNGWCQCERFQFACDPQVSRGAKPDDVNRCWHLKRARSYFLDTILPKLAQALKTPGPPDQPTAVTPLGRAKVAASALTRLGDLVALQRTVETKINELSDEHPTTT